MNRREPPTDAWIEHNFTYDENTNYGKDLTINEASVYAAKAIRDLWVSSLREEKHLGFIPLMQELTDTCLASIAEVGISDERKKYRRELFRRAVATIEKIKDKAKQRIPTLSTGVALGAWANPAGDSLPKSNITLEQAIEVINKNSATIEKLIDKLENGERKTFGG